MPTPEPLIISDENLIQHKDFITDPAWFKEKVITLPDGSTRIELPIPTYTVMEAAKFFFGKGADWMRWRSKKTEESPEGYFMLDGVPIEVRRTEKGFRYYTLSDIERMGHALAQSGGIDGRTLMNLIGLVNYSCRQWGYI